MEELCLNKDQTVNKTHNNVLKETHKSHKEILKEERKIHAIQTVKLTHNISIQIAKKNLIAKDATRDANKIGFCSHEIEDAGLCRLSL
jgi:hypothetical protein